MRYLAIVAAVGIVVFAFIAVLARSKTSPAETRRPDGSENYIHFFIVLRSPVEFDPSKLMTDFQHDWGTRIACEENKSWANPQQQTRGYLATDGKSGILITVSAVPLPEDLVKLTPAVGDISVSDREALFGQKAFIRVEYATGSAPPKERVSLASHVALSLLHIEQALGYINVAGQVYRTTKLAQPLTGVKDDVALYLACVGLQNVAEPGYRWMHTHGMEQFGLPDIEAKFDDAQQVSYYTDLIGNAALYCIEKGPVLKVNDTAELAGDGVNYRILPADTDPSHQYGHYGAIQISRIR